MTRYSSLIVLKGRVLNLELCKSANSKAVVSYITTNKEKLDISTVLKYLCALKETCERENVSQRNK